MGYTSIVYFFVSIVIFFFFKVRRWVELICGLYLIYFGRLKFGIKILKKKEEKRIFKRNY